MKKIKEIEAKEKICPFISSVVTTNYDDRLVPVKCQGSDCIAWTKGEILLDDYVSRETLKEIAEILKIDFNENISNDNLKLKIEEEAESIGYCSRLPKCEN